MVKKRAGGTARADKASALAVRCAIIPGNMRARGSLAGARSELAAVASLARDRVLIRKGGKADVLANLWFVRAGHEYAAAAAATPVTDERHAHLEFAKHVLLPLCQRIVQQFITDEGMGGVRMDDGGMLGWTGKKGRAALVGGMRLNALWYAALEATGAALRGKLPMGLGVKEAAGDHFERLAGRFRRSFLKVFWCDEHERICPPEARDQAGHGGLPDPEQALLSVLPASALPRTKQRGVLLQIGAASSDALGVRIHHPTQGQVESMLHRAWLVQGFAGLAEGEADRKQVAAFMQPLAALRETALHTGICGFYKDGAPVGHTPDPLATAEVLAALAQVGSAGKVICGESILAR